MKKEILTLFAAMLTLCGSAQTKKLSSGGLKGTRLASKQNSVSQGNRLSSAGNQEFEGQREKSINGIKYTYCGGLIAPDGSRCDKYRKGARYFIVIDKVEIASTIEKIALPSHSGLPFSSSRLKGRDAI